MNSGLVSHRGGGSVPSLHTHTQHTHTATASPALLRAGYGQSNGDVNRPGILSAIPVHSLTVEPIGKKVTVPYLQEKYLL
jgi:hypothetical protein